MSLIFLLIQIIFGQFTKNEIINILIVLDHRDPPQPWTLYTRFIKEEPSYELFESELVEDPIDIKPNVGQFRQQQFIENDDYIDDSNFDEEKPLKIPKKRKKFSNGKYFVSLVVLH